MLPTHDLSRVFRFCGDKDTLLTLRLVSKLFFGAVMEETIASWNRLPTCGMENLLVLDVNSLNLTELYIPRSCLKVSCRSNKLVAIKVPEGCEDLDCHDNRLVSLVIPTTCKVVNCSNNSIISLLLPEGCEELNCSNNRLTALTVPDEYRKLDCALNELLILIVGKGCVEVDCYDNRLETLLVSDDCVLLDCSGNDLTSLHVPENCVEICCNTNYLTYLFVPERCRKLDCSFNKISELIFEVNLKQTRRSLRRPSWYYDMFEIDCRFNFLEQVDIPVMCTKFICPNNKLTSLSVPEKCQHLSCSYNELTLLELSSSSTKVFCSPEHRVVINYLNPTKMSVIVQKRQPIRGTCSKVEHRFKINVQFLNSIDASNPCVEVKLSERACTILKEFDASPSALKLTAGIYHLYPDYGILWSCIGELKESGLFESGTKWVLRIAENSLKDVVTSEYSVLFKIANSERAIAALKRGHDTLYFKKYKDDLGGKMRILVHNKKPTAISAHSVLLVGLPESELQKLAEMACTHLSSLALPDDFPNSYSADMQVSADLTTLQVIWFDSFGNQSNMFDWANDHDVLHGDGSTVVFRLANYNPNLYPDFPEN